MLDAGGQRVVGAGHHRHDRDEEEEEREERQEPVVGEERRQLAAPVVPVLLGHGEDEAEDPVPLLHPIGGAGRPA